MIPAGHLAVAGAAMLFGSTFVVVKDALDGAATLPLLALRFALAGLVMAPFAHRRPATPGWLRDGVLCGVALLAGYVLQTMGLRSTSTTVSAFLTYLLVVIVPLLSAVFLRLPPRPEVAAGVVVATVGLFVLAGRGVALGVGEVLTIGCAIAFAAHVLLVAEASRKHDAVRLTAVQLGFVGAACLLPGAFGGGYDLSGGAFAAVAYLAFVSVAAFCLQVWGQARTSPTRASLLLMLEPVVAAVVGFAIGERVGLRGIAGAALILAGIVLAEMPQWRLTARSTS